MPGTKRPLKVFLCHAHSDAAAVGALYSRLTEEGVDVWLDKKKLLAGSNWELEIEKAVRDADVVVVCLSKQFNTAGFRQKEVRLAIDTAMEQPEGEIFIIPARLEECDVLPGLRRYQWVDLFEQDGYEKLSLALRARAERVHAEFSSKPSEPGEPSKKPKMVSQLERLSPSPLFIILALIASILAIIAFVSGKQSLLEFFSAQPATPTFSPTPQPTDLSETIEPTSRATEVLSPVRNVLPCDAAEIIEGSGVTYITLAPGALFKPVWRVRNVGSCTWSNYSLIFEGGNEMDTASSVKIDPPVAPGQTVDLMVTLTAPLSAGTYRGYWRIRNSTGILIGIEHGYEQKSLFVQIEVENLDSTAP